MSQYFENGKKHFELENYEAALELFILAYEKGENKEEIMDILFTCFLEPNLEELQQTYATGVQSITKIQFEDLKIIFFPVSDELFYIFDKERDLFLGKIDLNKIKPEKQIIEFDGVLVTDTWDFREVYSLLGNSYPRCVHWITNDENRTVAFLQIPGMMEKFWNNILLFHSEELFQFYFEQMKEDYLPHKIISKRVNHFSDILHKIHENRICDMSAKRNHIFISICIPSWNRGEDAYLAVCEALKSGYDQEIEIIVSNNGSSENTEGYEKIKAIQDNRIHYYEAPENRGFSGNIKQVIELARGEYIFFQSDQERLVSGCLPSYMNGLYRNSNVFAGVSSGEGPNFPEAKMKGVVDSRIDILNGIMNQTFLTGLILKKSAIENSMAMKYYEELAANRFLIMYTHIFYMLASFNNEPLYVGTEKLWIETFSATGGDSGVYRYNQPKDRMIQAEAAIELLVKVAGVVDYELMILLEARYKRVFDLLKVGIYYYEKVFRAEGFQWDQTCFEIYQWALKLGQSYREYISDDNFEIWENRCKEIYEKNCDENVWKSEGL